MADQSNSAMLGQASGINANLGAINKTLKSLFPLSAFSGTFVFGAVASRVVTDTNVKANSVIILQDTNAAAATLQQGANRIYPSAISSGVSFTVATASGSSAAGSENFSYLIVNVG